MSDLTPGNWIAFQNESQKRDIVGSGPRWSIGLDHPVELCRGVSGDDYMLVSGICTEADAKAMAASKELASALKALVNSFEKHRPKELWDNARAALAKAGAS